MRKSIRILLVIVAFVLLTGCYKGSTVKSTISNNTSITTPKACNSKLTSRAANIGDYYPFEKGIKYMYTGAGNEYNTYSVYVDYLIGNREQIIVNNGGTEAIKVLENKDGELRLISSKNEIYYRENFTYQINNNPEILLKQPLIKGTSWALKDGSKRTITNVKVAIKTPLASYECLEVTTVRKENTTKDYYAANIGLVKTMYANNGKVTSSLSKIEKKVPLVQTVKFYYPNGENSMNYVTDKKLSFNTNDITKKIFENYLREVPNNNVGKLISDNTKIKSLYLNKDNMVYLDFSKEFTQEMNAYSAYENQILQCITNTFADYYMVKKVYITVEGKPYSSGHISMKKGEAFIVDYKNTILLTQ
ncbi:GerMN domain-containing protein [Clostridium estertheticum]|uniref:GerMN domain-containing protein n=1 Tax=Clostridium estertheticum TaxID=238834 RepID=A0AA47ENL0_9CLOT|nr:GerMN domain-containing protein [Clostridium estertheticum]MBU3157144.1 GerMN domain-containing protein [Clostridium estertheticum]WAG62316.1 GerMN domain-containing protein [Clostridium estertheticum]